LNSGLELLHLRIVSRVASSSGSSTRNTTANRSTTSSCSAASCSLARASIRRGGGRSGASGGTRARGASLLSGRWADLITAENVEEILVITTCQRIILLTTIVLLEVGVEPLAELEVVEGARLHELGSVDVPLDAILVECQLQAL